MDPLDDGDPCTLDFCLNDSYPAVHDAPGANGDPCASDGDVCTLDVCDNGTCIHDPAGADGSPCAGDGDFCTVDECSGGVCTHANINSMVCEALAECPPNASNCTGSVGNPGLCECTPPKGPCYGDIFPPGGNGTADIDDLLCLLAGFANFADCSAGDIVPCAGNGIIDIDDVLGGLIAFTGNSICEGVPPCS